MPQPPSVGHPPKINVERPSQFDDADRLHDTRCYFNVRSKADMSQVNLPHGNDK